MEKEWRKNGDKPKVCLEMSELRWGICRFMALTCNVLFMIVLYCAMVDGVWVSAFADLWMMLWWGCGFDNNAMGDDDVEVFGYGTGRREMLLGWDFR